MSSATPARLRVGAAVAVPLLLGVALAVVTVISSLADARNRTDASVHALVAQTVTLVRTEVRNQLAAAPAGGQRGATLVPARDIARGPMSLDAAVTARDGGSATLDDIPGHASIVVPIYRGGSDPAAPPSAAPRSPASASSR